MPPDWQGWCRAAGLRVDGATVHLTLGDNRRHSVRVEESDDAYELSATVIGPARAYQITGLSLKVWRWNRNISLVGYRIDARGRLLGESWVPKIAVTPEEFAFYVNTLAAECDRLEYLLSGDDQE